MDPITLDAHPAEGHSGDYTVQVAGAIAEAVRVLNYASLAGTGKDGLPYPSTIYDVVGRLQAATSGMDQLFRQMRARLADIAAEHEVTVSHGLYRDNPAAAVADAIDALETEQRAADGLEGALTYAHNALSPIGVRIPADDEEAGQ